MGEYIPTPPYYLVPSHLGPSLAVSVDRRWRAARLGEVWHLYDDGECVLSTGQDLHAVQKFIIDTVWSEAE